MKFGNASLGSNGGACQLGFCPVQTFTFSQLYHRNDSELNQNPLNGTNLSDLSVCMFRELKQTYKFHHYCMHLTHYFKTFFDKKQPGEQKKKQKS